MTKKKRKIDFIYFDLGNVIISLDKKYVADSLAPASRHDNATLCQMFLHYKGLNNAFWQEIDRFDKGEYSDYDFYWSVVTTLALDSTKMDFFTFRSIWRDFIYIRQDSLELLKRIKGVRLGIISNLNRIHQARIFNMLPRDLFDIPIFSYVEQILKPDPEIYIRAIRAANVAPEQILFVDDVKANIDAAAAFGIRTFHFNDNVDELEVFMRSLGINIKSH